MNSLKSLLVAAFAVITLPAAAQTATDAELVQAVSLCAAARPGPAPRCRQVSPDPSVPLACPPEWPAGMEKCTDVLSRFHARERERAAIDEAARAASDRATINDIAGRLK